MARKRLFIVSNLQTFSKCIHPVPFHIHPDQFPPMTGIPVPENPSRPLGLVKWDRETKWGMVNWVVDDGFCSVSKSVWDDGNFHNMTGDSTTPEARRGGSEKPRRHAFGGSKTASIWLWKWKRRAELEPPAFSVFYDVSTEFDSEIVNSKRVMCSRCITGDRISHCLISLSKVTHCYQWGLSLTIKCLYRINDIRRTNGDANWYQWCVVNTWLSCGSRKHCPIRSKRH